MAWATRITSSYDMRTARCRAVSRSSRPSAPAALVGLRGSARADRDRAAHRRRPGRRRAGARLRRPCRAQPPASSPRSRARARRARPSAACARLPRAPAHAAPTCRRAPSRPARKPLRLLSTALPSARIAASNDFRRDRQAAAAGDQAEHHRVDHGAALLARAPPCRTGGAARACSLDRLEQRARCRSGRRPSPSSRPPGRSGWSRRSAAVRSGVTKPVRDGAPGLEQFARHARCRRRRRRA